MHGKPVADEQMVCGGERAAALTGARGVGARRVADEGAAEGLVERDPAVHPVTEPGGDHPGVLGEPLSRLAYPPAAPVRQGLGEVPVVEGGGGGDAGGQQLVDEPVVEVEPRRVGGAGAGRLDTRPGDG